ncbi:unnamed protein product [Sphagnum balticum]
MPIPFTECSCGCDGKSKQEREGIKCPDTAVMPPGDVEWDGDVLQLAKLWGTVSILSCHLYSSKMGGITAATNAFFGPCLLLQEIDHKTKLPEPDWRLSNALEGFSYSNIIPRGT